MADSHKNAAYSLVATAPSPATSGTTLVVTTGEGARFPTPPFNATVWAFGAQPMWTPGTATGGNFEIVRVTAVSTDTLTITRAQETTSARTIVAGDQIAATITTKTLTDVEGYTFVQTIGDGTSTQIDVTHNLNTRALSATLQGTASPFEEVYPHVEYPSLNVVRLNFDAAPAAGAYTLVLLGKGAAAQTVASHASTHNPGGSDPLNFSAITATVTGNTQTASYTLALSDAGKVVEQNSASATVVTIPPNSAIAFPVGTVIEIARIGAGSVTITPGAGVTIPNRLEGSGTTSRLVAFQFSSVSIRQRATDSWQLIGDFV